MIVRLRLNADGSVRITHTLRIICSAATYLSLFLSVLYLSNQRFILCFALRLTLCRVLAQPQIVKIRIGTGCNDHLVLVDMSLVAEVHRVAVVRIHHHRLRPQAFIWG